MKVQINKNITPIKQTSTTTTQIASNECCMCGDYGFSYDLYQCKLCQFRCQHRYCSNLYPNVDESHRICNWCLLSHNKDEGKLEKSQNSSNSSSSFKNNDDDAIKIKKPKPSISNVKTQSHQRSGAIGPIKKQRSVETAASGRKRIVSAAAKEEAERLRRTRSEDISVSGITKQVFRNRVRRYKLLDEVSS